MRSGGVISNTLWNQVRTEHFLIILLIYINPICFPDDSLPPESSSSSTTSQSFPPSFSAPQLGMQLPQSTSYDYNLAPYPMNATYFYSPPTSYSMPPPAPPQHYMPPLVYPTYSSTPSMQQGPSYPDYYHPVMPTAPPPPLAAPAPTSTAQGHMATTNNNGSYLVSGASSTNGGTTSCFQVNMMSPSLTSGFSGSGGDCKSTETSSILSAASHASSIHRGSHKYNNSNSGILTNGMGRNGVISHGVKGNEASSSSKTIDNNNMSKKNHASNKLINGNNQSLDTSSRPSRGDMLENKSSSKGSCDTKKNNGVASSSSHGDKNGEGKVNLPLNCDMCQMSFSSQTVLESHLAGIKHSKRVMQSQKYIPVDTTSNGIRKEESESESPVSGDSESGSEIRCGICQVSVNSSHQLQTHLAGKLLEYNNSNALTYVYISIDYRLQTSFAMSPTGNSSPISAADPVFLALPLRMLSSPPDKRSPRQERKEATKAERHHRNQDHNLQQRPLPEQSHVPPRPPISPKQDAGRGNRYPH